MLFRSVRLFRSSRALVKKFTDISERCPYLWRAGGRSCWRRRAEIEIHGRRSFRARLRGEEWPRRKTEHAGDKICRKAPRGRVVTLHRSVEVAALDRNSVLRAFELGLQAEKALVRL